MQEALASMVSKSKAAARYMEERGDESMGVDAGPAVGGPRTGGCYPAVKVKSFAALFREVEARLGLARGLVEAVARVESGARGGGGMECRQEKNVVRCTCTYEPCERKGLCCECVAYHRSRGELPGCFFPPDAERSYDRSVEAFVRCHRKR